LIVIAAIGEYGELAEATKCTLVPTFALFAGDVTVTPAKLRMDEIAQNSAILGT
jgi:hypothetical protein